ncbi:PLP-dependent aminotransferase family protein [Paraburkholderia sp. LEh10]|uniref:aminotransferase-like domain-containing protein n=1 Tax=Paraburkholderia sp. LEh10 TaxID=2821353 RepID=UPI001AE1DB6A|nr:PLP-dependent aminotransferase family protein [Paraburkholderia sp. LEh10]MBP0589228.1 PLP-dependent aminotransferase family protein [Paraburkholderia sp. LEh10]
MTRYEALANTMAAEIRSGSLAVGARMPSLRQVIAQHGVSQSTAFRAYYLLEEWGLIRAQERSGYYVAPGAAVRGKQEAVARRALAESAKVDISELVFSVLEAAKHTNVVPLGSAFPSPVLFPLPRLAKSLAQTSRSMNPWSTVVDLPPGNEALRQQIALRYLGMGLSQPLDEIVVTNGALEALNLCLMAVTRPGDVVAVESPGFYAALQAIERLDLRVVEIPVDPQSGLDLDALAQALDKHPIRACWFMTNYQNPTGATMPLERKKALVELLARHEVPLIEDDVYGELHFQADYPLPAIAFDRKGLVMHCSSFSKTLAPGYRIGWAAAGRFAEKVQRAKLMTTLSASIPVQAGIADYLQHGGYDRHLRKLRAALRAQLDAVNLALRRAMPKGVKWTCPSGGYFVWLELPEQIDALMLHRQAIEQGVSLAPGPIFSASRGFRHCVRLNFGHPWSADIDRAIRILGELIAKAAAGGRADAS